MATQALGDITEAGKLLAVCKICKRFAGRWKMRIALLLSIGVGLLISIAKCAHSSFYHWNGIASMDAVGELEIGMSKETVDDRLGKPLQEGVVILDRVYYSATYAKPGWGFILTPQDCISATFQSNKLIGAAVERKFRFKEFSVIRILQRSETDSTMSEQ